MIKKKILIAEDDKAGADLLEKILVKSGYSVHVTPNGVKAYSALNDNRYDLLLTDWMMPQMDGIELIRKVRKNINPAPIIVVITALSSPEARRHALESGADDFIAKPYKLNDILDKLKDIFLRADQQPPAPSIIPLIKPDKPAPFTGICITASSGGPQTLTELFISMPIVDNAAFFVVQHGPTWALKDMADRWNKSFRMEVFLGVDGVKVEPRKIYLAPGEYHMIVEPDPPKLRLDDGPPENFIKPAADPLFRSVARTFGKNSIAVIMTGMGFDGAEGAKYISAAQGIVIVQDPETAIVDSMPMAVINTIADSIVIPLNEIPDTIVRIAGEKSSSSASENN